MTYSIIPCDYLLGVPVTYPPDRPPCCPQRCMVESMTPYLPWLASVVANTVSMEANAQSPVRIYAYNVLSQNNWNNTEYEYLINLAAGAIASNIATERYRDTDTMLIEKTIGDVVTAFSSYAFMQNPQNMQRLPSEIQSAIYTNVKYYEQYVNMLDQIRMAPRMTMGHRQQPQQHATPMRGMVPGHPTAQSHHAQLMQRQPSPLGMRQTTLGMAGQEPQLPAQFAVSRHRRTVQPTMPEPAARITEITPMASAPMAPAPSPVISTPTQLEPKTLKGETMDRTVHTQAYRSFIYEGEEAERMAVEAQDRTKSRMAPFVESLSDPAKTQVEDGLILTELCEDNAILKILAKYSNQLDQPLALYKNTVTLLHPIIGSTPFREAYEKLSSAESFADFADFVRNYVKYKSTDEFEERKNFGWMVQLDRHLTRMVNHWLSMGSLDQDLSIDSFLSDVKDMSWYFRDKSAEINRSYTRFQTLVLSSIRNWLTDNEMTIPEAVEFGAVDHGVIPENTVMYYINETMENLNYDISKTPKRVDPDETSSFHSLCQRIVLDGRSRSVSRLILVTADNFRFCVQEQIGKTNKYTVKEL